MARLKVLLVGAGTVGEAIAKIARGKPWLEAMVLADYNVGRAREVQSMLGDGAAGTFPAEFVDAGDIASVVQLAHRHHVDLVMNAASWLRGRPDAVGITANTHVALTLTADPLLRSRLVLVPTVMAVLGIIAAGTIVYVARRE